MHKAGLNGEPIGENKSADGELGHLQGHQNDAFNISNENFPRHVEHTTGPSFDDIACSVGWNGFDKNDLIGANAHCRSQKLQGEAPTINESVSIDAGKKACQVLVVKSKNREVVEVHVLEHLDEVEDIPFGQIVREGLWE